ncbi:MAG: aldo/keto reductase [Solirubrobacteraceae bacterium]
MWENLKLVTKVGGRRDEAGAWLPAQTPQELREGVEDNLRSLLIERMDLVNLRLMDEDEAPVVPLAEQLGALEDLRQKGKLELIGISSAGRERIEQALELVEISEIQNSYSIIDREDDPIVELARERGIAFVPFFPLGSAFTGGPSKLAQDQTISKVAEKHGATASQVALAWLLARYERMLLIPGATSVAHLEENLAAIDLQLDVDDLAKLDAVEQVGRPLG